MNKIFHLQKKDLRKPKKWLDSYRMYLWWYLHNRTPLLTGSFLISWMWFQELLSQYLRHNLCRIRNVTMSSNVALLFRTHLHISLMEYLSRKLENHMYQHNLSRFQKVKVDLQIDLSWEKHFYGCVQRFVFCSSSYLETLAYLNSNGLLSESIQSQLASLK